MGKSRAPKGLVIIRAAVTVALLAALWMVSHPVVVAQNNSQGVSTVAGNGQRSLSLEETILADHGPYGVPGPSAKMSAPKGLALDPLTGEVFVAESDSPDWDPDTTHDQDHIVGVSPRVLKIRSDSQRTLVKVIGPDDNSRSSPSFPSGEAPPNQTRVHTLYSVGFDNNGDLYIVAAEAIFKLERLRDNQQNPLPIEGGPGETKMVIVGFGTPGVRNDGVSGRNLDLYHPRGVAFDHKGALFIAHEDNHSGRIRKISPGLDGKLNGGDDEIAVTVAGGVSAAVEAVSPDGVPARTSILRHPNAVEFDTSGHMFIADRDNHSIRRVTPGANGEIDGAGDEIISTVAGSGDRTAGSGGDGDSATTARLNLPRDIVFDPAGNLFIADGGNNRIRKVIPGTDGLVDGSDDEKISTVAGDGTTPPNPREAICGDPGAASCLGRNMKLNVPYNLAVAPCPPNALTTDLYVSEQNNHRVRLVSGVAECPRVDLAIQDILDNPEPVTSGSLLTYSIEVVNKGPSAATGVKLTNILPPEAVFRSASSPGGDCTAGGSPGSILDQQRVRIICPLGQMPGGSSSTVKVVVTPTAHGTIKFKTRVDATNPLEPGNLSTDNEDEESTTVVLPTLPALPPLPALELSPLSGGGNSSSGRPPPGQGPPGQAPLDPNQSTLSVTPPPGGPGSAAPSTVPVSGTVLVPGTSAQPGGTQVPLTGSLGFQQGQASVPDTAPAASAAATTPQEMAGATAGAAASAAVPEEQAQAAPRYSMVAADGALYALAGFSTGAVLLSVLACVLIAGSPARPMRPVPAWGYAAGRSPLNKGRPAI